MTAQETYTIKDAAKKVQVEAHVLRYWEEELRLPIGRNELGHRFYTEKDVELLGHVRDWKQQGLQLKAIRLMLSEDGRLAVPQEVVRQVQSMVETGVAQLSKTAEAVQPTKSEDGAAQVPKSEDGAAQVPKSEDGAMQVPKSADGAMTPESETGAAQPTAAGAAAVQPSIEAILLDERSAKAAKLQLLLENLVSRTVQESNAVILKELDFQFRQMEENAQEREKKRMEREEERYRKLDELICQRSRRKRGRRRGL